MQASERAQGALIGLRAGEVLGLVAQGLPSAPARAAISSAFPDFGRTTPVLADTLALLNLGGTSLSAEPQTPGASVMTPNRAAVPEWLATAVATGLCVGSDPISQVATEVGELLPTGSRDRLSHAGAAAIAGAVSAAVDGAGWHEALSLGIAAADAAESSPGDRIVFAPGPAVGARIAWAHAIATKSPQDGLGAIELLVGASGLPQEAVPAAFAVIGLVVPQWEQHHCPPLEIARQAAGLGGAACLIAGAAGAMAGALADGGRFPPHLSHTVDGLDVAAVMAGRAVPHRPESVRLARTVPSRARAD